MRERENGATDVARGDQNAADLRILYEHGRLASDPHGNAAMAVRTVQPSAPFQARGKRVGAKALGADERDVVNDIIKVNARHTPM